jgi:hypothetical protein
VSRDAAKRIIPRGGRLYLWNEPFGRIGLRDRLAFEVPSRGEFVCHRDAKTDVQVCLPRDAPFSEVIVRARRWPFRGARVYANGRRWGWRGEWFSTYGGS